MPDESPLRAIFMNQESLNRAKYSWSSAEFSRLPRSAEEEAAEGHAHSPVVVGVAVVFRRSFEWMIEGVLADESLNRKVYEGYEHLRSVALLWKTLPRAGANISDDSAIQCGQQRDFTRRFMQWWSASI